MGKLQNGFSGGFNGRIGNLVGYQWRGKWCVRSLPSQYRDAKTERQLEQRNLYKQTIDFTSRARQVLHLGLREQSLKAYITEYNYFMRINKRCFALADGELQVDYESIVLADGPVAPVAFYTPQLVDETTISVDFEKNPLHRATKSEDEVYLAAYCPELKSFALSRPSYRYKSNVVIQFNPLFAGKEVHLWGFVVDKAGRASQSQYIGCGVLSADDELFDAASEDAASLEDAFEGVAHGDRSYADGGAGIDKVARAKKHKIRDVGNHPIDTA